MNPITPHAGDAAADRDRGSVLVLVLVLLLISSLIVLPLLSYSMSVMKANTVLSDKTQRLETVKAGLRVALSNPVDLYDYCAAGGGPTVAKPLADVTVNGMTVTTRCYFIDYEAAQSSEELRMGVVATRAGQAPPAALTGTKWAPSSADTAEWWPLTTKDSVTGKIWLPNLPTSGLNPRSSGGFAMPTEYGGCTVYFPGTFQDSVTITGKAFFTSGVYYFEAPITFAPGADVVMGQGATEGCATDQEAAFYAVNAPSTHNINGLGATLVFGDRGRFVVDNTTGTNPIAVRINSRYAMPGDVGASPSAGVSIMTVNGDLAVDGVTGTDLDVPGQMRVPLSMVGAEPLPTDTNPVMPVPATTQQYVPSKLTPEPSAPDAPTGVTATPYSTAAIVSWTAPADGGSPITGYTVTSTPGSRTCTTIGATRCTVTGLTNGTAYTFAVTATNALGTSLASPASTAVTPSTTPGAPGVPARPAAPTAVAYDSAARVTFTASTSTAPIVSYTVTPSPSGTPCTLRVDAAVSPTLQCDVTGLTNGTPTTFTVTATNAAGNSTASVVSAAVTPAAAAGAPPAVPPVTPTVSAPAAVVDFRLSGTPAVTVDIPGYISIPQGRFRIDNPTGKSVTLSGGVLSGQYDVVDSRGSAPGSVPVGFIETVVQRQFRIVSTTSSGHEASTAIVQINQNGAYAINAWEVQ